MLAEILNDNGYLVDSSVTPYTNWSSHMGIPFGNGGPDFIDCVPFPYNYQFHNGILTEIPITILPTLFPLNRSNYLSRKYFRYVDNLFLLRVVRKIFYHKQPLWLRPFSWMTINLIEQIVEEAIRIRLPYLVMMFHSSELMPGSSIYRKSENAIEELFDFLESCFLLLNTKNIRSITLTEAALNYRA